MMICSVSDSFVALDLDKSSPVDCASAEAMVRGELEKQKKDQWKSMEIDCFAAGNSIFLLARPGEISRVYIAPYALPWLMDYFTE